LVEFLKLFHRVFFMRLLIEDIITDLKRRLNETKGLRNKVFLKDALKALHQYKAVNEKKI